MTAAKKLTYKLLPEWVIRQENKSLIISGGADAKYEIELEGGEPSFFSNLKNNSFFSRDQLDEQDERVLEELVTAEIVVPRLEKDKGLKVALFGDAHPFVFMSSDKVEIVKNDQDYDLGLIIRVNNTYAGLLQTIKYRSIAKPHLFVDVAFHHTFSIGPLVFPGETACIACLEGRISVRWEDERPPSMPLVASKYKGLIPELITTELTRIANGDTSLTNKTVSWNFLDRSVKKDQLLKVPICPVCTQNRIDQSGALVLPWGKA